MYLPVNVDFYSFLSERNNKITNSLPNKHIKKDSLNLKISKFPT